jgi:hypothetical protein
MTDFTGTLITPDSALGLPGSTTKVVAKFTFDTITLADGDTLTAVMFTQNGIEVPVDILGFELFSSTTTPASLALMVGNSDDDNGFMKIKGATETGQCVRKGDGELLGTRVKNKTVVGEITTTAGAAYTGDVFFAFDVRVAKGA